MQVSANVDTPCRGTNPPAARAYFMALRGFDAKYMAGGHYGWKAMKGAVKLLEARDVH